MFNFTRIFSIKSQCIQIFIGPIISTYGNICEKFFNLNLNFFLIENRLDDRGDTSKRSAENFLESQQQIKNRRLGKDDKLAKEAKLPFTVRVR